MSTHTTTRQPTIDATTDTDALTVTLAFSNGETLVIDATTLSSDVQAQATLHGLKQKLVDAAAISRNPENGRSATVEDKYNAVREVYDRLLAGHWNKARGEGAGSGGAGGLLFRALCQVYDQKTPEQIRTFLAGKSAKEKAALRAVPRIADAIAAMRKAAPEDEGDLLAGLDD